ncbi:hypothetical protein [Endozoicomonas lisbonensis]|uniref:DUF1508 domain-containing protein n=1 Tax=Endozoicomonas lisbonensis TaxID=3120522 RepID=A0ABV2SP52_9GAMM
MKFIKKDQYYARSECGRFQLSVARLAGKVTYSAWDLKVASKKSIALVAGVSLAAAKKACMEVMDVEQ